MYVCIVQNLYNYKTPKFFEKVLFGILKSFDNTNALFSALYLISQNFKSRYLFSCGRKLLRKISRN